MTAQGADLSDHHSPAARRKPEQTKGSLLRTLTAASADGRLEEVQKLYYQWERMEDPRGALSAAIDNQHPVIVSYLLEQGLPIHRDDVSAAMKCGSTEILQVFLDHGWNINANVGEHHLGHPLVYHMNNHQLLKWCLDHGADPNANCHGILRSLFEAAAYNAMVEEAEMMLHYGAKIQASNALMMAVRGRKPTEQRLQMATWLLDHGALVDARENEHNKTQTDGFGRADMGTALHAAARLGREAEVQLLLKRGANRSVQDAQGRTALDVAEEGGLTEVVGILSNVE